MKNEKKDFKNSDRMSEFFKNSWSRGFQLLSITNPILFLLNIQLYYVLGVTFLSFINLTLYILCRLPKIYEEFYHTVNNADHEKDLRWWSNTHGVNMPMNWPQFEVSTDFFYFLALLQIKVHIFWEGHKILRNLHRRFVLWSASQIYTGDIAKFCGLLRIYEL